MWFCFNDAFVSVVAHKDNHNLLVVRARSEQHLKNIFGETVGISVDDRADYRYRLVVPKTRWVDVVASRIEAIDYTNFKASVKEDRLHSLYEEFWHAHAAYQNGADWRDDLWDIERKEEDERREIERLEDEELQRLGIEAGYEAD